MSHLNRVGHIDSRHAAQSDHEWQPLAGEYNQVTSIKHDMTRDHNAGLSDLRQADRPVTPFDHLAAERHQAWADLGVELQCLVALAERGVGQGKPQHRLFRPEGRPSGMCLRA